MKILIIMPWDRKHKRYRNAFSKLTAYAPLTLPTLAGLIPRDYDTVVEACDEMIEDAEKYLDRQYDIVMLSFITPSCMRAYELAEKFRSKGAYIAAGGYHATFIPEEVSQYVDTVIIGEGEISVPKFIEDYRNGCPQRIYHFPDVTEKDRKRPDRSVLKKQKYSGVMTMIASKGCPNNCVFCAISKMSNKVPREISDVIDEMKSSHRKQFIFFDPNFFGNREYAVSLMTEMTKLKIKWMGTATINAAFDDELMKLAKKSGCFGLLVGIESINSESLKDMNKDFVKPDSCKEAIERFNNYGISINGCFVLGFDEDTEEELLSLPKRAEELKLNLVRYAVLTPTPNSELYKKLESEDRITVNDWSRYTQNEVVFKPKNISAERLAEIYSQVWRESFTLKNILRRVKAMDYTGLWGKFIILCINIGFKFVGADDYKASQSSIEEKCE